jgi:tryptophanyl-tRNA synthetase
MTSDDTRPRVFSGIQPTGRKTLGNYSGGFRQYVETQERGDGFFCIVDLHSLSVDYDPADLRSSTFDLAALLFATGLDADRSTVFCQSHVTAHAEASWLLSAVTGYGQLGRMTQFKDKSSSQEFVSAALFTYPILMAGDILLYQTDIVPIGDDQRQHLELTRDIAQRFNHRFGETFRIPEGVFPQIGGRIMDLQEPTNKMSTSTSSEQGAVYLSDSPDAIRKKFRSAVTDSEREVRYDPEEKPGVSNLLEIMSVAGGEPIATLEQRFAGSGYGDLKEAVGESVVALLAPFQERYAALRADEAELQRLLAVGAEKARSASGPTIQAMYDHMGFAR